MIAQETRRCPRCTKVKHFTEYHHKTKNGWLAPDGTQRQGYCAACNCAEYTRRFKHDSVYRAKHGRTDNRAHNRRRATLEQSGGAYTEAEWQAILAHYGYRCLACGTTEHLTVDHVIPVTLGGTNDWTNLQPLCKRCNSSKNSKYLDYRPAACGIDLASTNLGEHHIMTMALPSSERSQPAAPGHAGLGQADYRQILLSPAQVKECLDWGELRISESARQGLKDNWGLVNLTPERDRQMQLMGTAGEYAVALYLDLPITFSVNTFKEPDLVLPLADGTERPIQVKASMHVDHLTVRRDARDHEAYVFVRIRRSSDDSRLEAELRGWLTAYEARLMADCEPAYWADPQGRGSPAIFIPTSALRPIASITNPDVGLTGTDLSQLAITHTQRRRNRA